MSDLRERRVILRKRLICLVISSPSLARSGPPFILLPDFTGVPILRVAVGAGVIAASKIGGAFHASLLWPPRPFSPHFNLACGLSFSAGGRRFFDFIRGALPGCSFPEEFVFSFFVSRCPTTLAESVSVSSSIRFTSWGGAFAEVRPVAQDHRIRRSDCLRAGLFVMYPLELTDDWFIGKGPFCLRDTP